MVPRQCLIGMLAGLCSHLAAEATIACEVAVPDLPALLAHAQRSPYSELATSPLLAVARASVSAYLHEQAEAFGCDLGALVRSATSLREQVLCETTTPRIVYRIAVQSPQAGTAWSGMAAHAASPPPVAWGPWLITGDGDWLSAGRDVQPVIPPSLRDPAPGADLEVRVQLPAICQALGCPSLGLAARRLGLVALECTSTLGPQGSQDLATIPAVTLPLRPIDPQVFALLPPESCVVWAVGIDGQQLWTILTQGGADALLPATAVTALQELVKSTCGRDAVTIIQALEGTVALGLTTGVPYPAATLVVPRSPFLDDALRDINPDNPALTPTTQVGVLIPGQAVLIEARRNADYWIFTTEARIANPDTDAIGRFDYARALATQGLDLRQPPPVALAWQDNRQLITGLGALLPLWRSSEGDAQEDGQGWVPSERSLDFLEQLAACAGPLLPDSLMLASQGPRGLRLQARNGIAQGGLLGVGIMCCAPIIMDWQETQRRTRMITWENALSSQCQGYANTHHGEFPPTLAALQQMHQQVSDITALLQAPDAPRSGVGYLYVRPCATCSESKQPYLIEDPARSRGKGSVVAFADGHVEYQEGTKLWTTAVRLSQLPDIAIGGITPALWGITPSVLANPGSALGMSPADAPALPPAPVVAP